MYSFITEINFNFGQFLRAASRILNQVMEEQTTNSQNVISKFAVSKSYYYLLVSKSIKTNTVFTKILLEEK